MTPRVLSLVERGWQSARTAELQPPSPHVIHLVKGRLAPSVRRLAGLSAPVRLVGSFRALFWPLAWGCLAGLRGLGRLQAVWVDNAKSYRRLAPWCRRLGIDLIMLSEPEIDASRRDL